MTSDGAKILLLVGSLRYALQTRKADFKFEPMQHTLISSTGNEKDDTTRMFKHQYLMCAIYQAMLVL